MLIGFFSTGAECDSSTNGIYDKDIIAWLEKQKEFVSVNFEYVWKTTDCKKMTDPLDKYEKYAIKNLCHAWYDKGIELERKKWLEKHGEQNPNYCHHEVDLSKCSEEYRKAYYDGWNNCNQQHSQLRAYHKPAWSEEDMSKVQRIRGYLNEAKKYYADITEVRECMEWLDTLKDKYTWKPSKEQIDAFLNILLEV